MRPARSLLLTLVLVLPAAGQQPPVFRSGVTLVPIDVRVVDRAGKPVTDLKAEDFTITEDGIRQDIRHFAPQALAAGGLAPDAKLVLRKDAAAFVPQTNRIFLIVLGRGKLQEPSKAVDAIARFVRERLLARDQVAVFAYNRATTFTTDHESVARLLDRFKSMHEQIDRVFDEPGLAVSHRVEPGAQADKRVEKDVRRQTDALIQKEAETAREEAAAAAGIPHRTAWSELDEIQTGMFADLSLETFVSTTAQTLQDLGNLYAGINYLRHFEGEKHLVFLTERGLTLPRVDEDERLAAEANDARVVLDTIETGGIYVGQAGGAMPEGRWNQTFAFRTLRTIAELTGGVSSIAEAGTTAANRLDEVTRATYQIGFYPTNARWDGKYRDIDVRVSRPGVTALYRRGYYGRKDIGAFNRREFITADRIKAAAAFRREIKDIRLKVDAALRKSDAGSGYELTVDLRIDPARLALAFVEGARVGQVTIAVFCFDEKGAGLGGNMETADIKLADDGYKNAVESGIPYKVTYAVNPGVRKVRVVVYDFKADLVGTADKSVL